jgi:hypothetical protein
MSCEIPPFDIRLCRRIADSFQMSGLCMRRSCRRNRVCKGNVSATGEPDCILPLPEAERDFFAAKLRLADDFASLVRKREKIPITGARESVYIQNLCLLIVMQAFSDLPANRAALRAYSRKIGGLPALGPAPRNVAPFYRDFGIPAPVQTSPAAGTIEGRAQDAANHAPAATDGGSVPLPEAEAERQA